MITQCAVRTPQGILPVEAPATVAQQQDACVAAGADYHEAEAGFLTSSGVFLTRSEALSHAFACGQVPSMRTGYLLWGDLHTER